MDSRKRNHWQIDEEEDNESIVEEADRPSTSQTEGSRPPDHSEETTPPADLPQEALRDVYGDLTNQLHSPSLVEHLYTARILTDVEYETINSRGSNHDKNTEVLAAMRRRSKSEVLQFCQLLFTHNQHNCGRIMFAALRNRGVNVSSITVPSPNPPPIKNSSPRYYPEMTALDDAFTSLVREVNRAGRSVEDFKVICVQLLSTVTSTQRNVQQDIDKLMECSSGDCILYLQPYWDSLDCDLLYRLIRQLKKPELMTDWEKYRTQVKEACRGTLVECRRNLPQGRELSANQISAGFQTDQPPNDVTVQKILDLKDFLKKMMGLEEADFEGFANSDVTLFYTVGRIRLPCIPGPAVCSPSYITARVLCHCCVCTWRIYV